MNPETLNSSPLNDGETNQNSEKSAWWSNLSQGAQKAWQEFLQALKEVCQPIEGVDLSGLVAKGERIPHKLGSYIGLSSASTLGEEVERQAGILDNARKEGRECRKEEGGQEPSQVIIFEKPQLAAPEDDQAILEGLRKAA